MTTNTGWTKEAEILIPMQWGLSKRVVRSNGETSQIRVRTSAYLPMGDDLNQWLENIKSETEYLVDARIEFWPGNDEDSAELAVTGWSVANPAQHEHAVATLFPNGVN